MKNKIYYNLLIAISFLIFAVSCKSTKDTTAPKVTTAEEIQGTKWANNLTWKVTGKDLKKPSYVFGTMHMIPKDKYFLPAGTEAAFNSSEKVIFEIDLNDMSDMGALMGLMTQAFMNDGKTLKDVMSAENYNLVNEHFSKMGLPMMFMEKIKPMFLSMLASPDFSPDALQSGDIVSYETEFFQKALTDEKSVGGLETIESQMGIFDSIPYEAQADMLVEAIKSGQGESDLLDRTIQLYLDQDIEGMLALMDDDEGGLGGYNDIFLNNRNKNWIPIMSAEMSKQSTFFAVGAGHLAGEEGVLTLLKKEGYKIEKI